MVHSIEKTLSENADKFSDDEKSKVEAAIKDLKAVVDGDDKSAIETKLKAVEEAFAPVAQKMYAEAGAQMDPSQMADQMGGAQADNSQSGEDVVDAEFEEVKDDKK